MNDTRRFPDEFTTKYNPRGRSKREAVSFPCRLRPRHPREDELEPRTRRTRGGREVERLSDPLSRNASVNHDFIADDFTRSRGARRNRHRRLTTATSLATS